MTIEINEVVYDNIPENYSEMNIEQLMNVAMIKEKANIDLIDIISALIGTDRSVLENMYIDDVTFLLEEFNWLASEPEKVINKSIEIEGKTYIAKENYKLTWGEQISIESFLKNEVSNISNFHLVLAILYRPGTIIDDIYKQNPLEDDMEVVLNRAELFKKKMMVTDVYGVIDFFSNGGKGYTTKNMPRSSTLKIVKRNQSSEQ
jgi:hypothetical protein